MIGFRAEDARSHRRHIWTVYCSVPRFSAFSAHRCPILTIEVLLGDSHIKLSFAIIGDFLGTLWVNNGRCGSRRVGVLWNSDFVIWVTWLWWRALFVVQKYHFLGIGLCFFILLYFYFWFIAYSLDYLNEGNTRLIRINCRWRMCYSWLEIIHSYFPWTTLHFPCCCPCLGIHSTNYQYFYHLPLSYSCLLVRNHLSMMIATISNQSPRFPQIRRIHYHPSWLFLICVCFSYSIGYATIGE